MKSRFKLILILTAVTAGLIIFLRSGVSASALWQLSEGGQWLPPLVFASALIDSINPCAFSILLLTIAFLFSIGKLRTGILKIGSAYIFGIFLAYLLIGLGLLQAFHLFNTPHFLAKIGAALIIVLGGINIIGEFFPKFPIKLKIPHAAHRKMAELMEKSSVPTAFVLGGLVGLCEFPCTGGPYLAVIGLLHDQATYLKGLVYLVAYNLIFILPLVLILLLGSNEVVLAKLKSWQTKNSRRMRFLGGVAMVALGIVIFMF